MSTATQSLAIPRVGLSALLRDYSVLVKARVTTLIILTTWCGAYLAAAKSGLPSLSWTIFNALLSIGLVSGGTAALNEVMERDLDARMRRTAGRPLVTKSLSVLHGSLVAFGMTIGGLIYLWLTTNWQAALLTGLTSASYLLVYTPMKQVHVVLPGKADAAVDLDCFRRHVLRHVGCVRLCHRHRGRRFRAFGIDGPARVVGQRARVLDRDHHIDALMLDGLERSDRLAELHARLGVFDRHVERALRRPDHLGRQPRSCDVERAPQSRPSLAFLAEQFGGLHIVEFHVA